MNLKNNKKNNWTNQKMIKTLIKVKIIRKCKRRI